MPTPALAAYAMARSAPAVTVTGSHIPESYNGIKFYRPEVSSGSNYEACTRKFVDG